MSKSDDVKIFLAGNAAAHICKGITPKAVDKDEHVLVSAASMALIAEGLRVATLCLIKHKLMDANAAAESVAKAMIASQQQGEKNATKH